MYSHVDRIVHLLNTYAVRAYLGQTLLVFLMTRVIACLNHYPRAFNDYIVVERRKTVIEHG